MILVSHAHDLSWNDVIHKLRSLLVAAITLSCCKHTSTSRAVVLQLQAQLLYFLFSPCHHRATHTTFLGRVIAPDAGPDTVLLLTDIESR
jgi:hypothetical protein